MSHGWLFKQGGGPLYSTLEDMCGNVLASIPKL